MGTVYTGQRFRQLERPAQLRTGERQGQKPDHGKNPRTVLPTTVTCFSQQRMGLGKDPTASLVLAVHALRSRQDTCGLCQPARPPRAWSGSLSDCEGGPDLSLLLFAGDFENPDNSLITGLSSFLQIQGIKQVPQLS